MQILIALFKSIPWWINLIFLYLIYEGIRAMKPRVHSYFKLLLFPPLLFYLIMRKMALLDLTSLLDLSVWFLFLLLGFIVTWRIFRHLAIRADRKHYKIELPGSKAVLLIFGLVIVFKLAYGYFFQRDEAAGAIGSCLAYSFIALCGLVLGLFLGRYTRAMTLYWKAPNARL